MEFSRVSLYVFRPLAALACVWSLLSVGCSGESEGLCLSDGRCAELEETTLFPGPCKAYIESSYSGAGTCSYEYDDEQRLIGISRDVPTGTSKIAFGYSSMGSLAAITFTGTHYFPDVPLTQSFGSRILFEDESVTENGAITENHKLVDSWNAVHSLDRFDPTWHKHSCETNMLTLDSLVTIRHSGGEHGPGQEFRFEYDGLPGDGEAVQVRTDADTDETRVAEFQYNEDGRLTGRVLGEARTEIGYSDDGDLAFVESDLDGADFYRRDTYTSDVAGNLRAFDFDLYGYVTERTIYDYSCWD